MVAIATYLPLASLHVELDWTLLKLAARCKRAISVAKEGGPAQVQGREEGQWGNGPERSSVKWRGRRLPKIAGPTCHVREVESERQTRPSLQPRGG